MNNIIKTGLLTFVFTAIIAIGFFGITTATTIVDGVFVEIDKEGKNSNINDDEGSIATTTISLKNNSEKCSPLDPRGC
jgi:hypothetical protein